MLFFLSARAVVGTAFLGGPLALMRFARAPRMPPLRVEIFAMINRNLFDTTQVP